MKKILKSFYIIILIFCIFYICFGIKNESLAVNLGVSGSAVTVGDTTTINVTIPAGYVAYEGNVSFDTSKLSYVSSTSGNLVGDVIKVADANMQLQQVSNFSITFKGISSGSARVSVNLTLSNSDATSTPSASGSSTITVSAVEQETVSKTEQPVQETNTSVTTSNSNDSVDVENVKHEKEPIFTQINETVYATKSMNVRSSWSTSSNKIGGLTKGQAVIRTGIGDNGWSRISYNGTVAYVSTSLITTTKPEEEITESVEEIEEEQIKIENNEEPIENQNIEEPTEEEKYQEKYQEIVTKIGTIPEVGVNYNLFVYIILTIISGISIFVILKGE